MTTAIPIPTSASELVSRVKPHASFSGHETFVFRYGWMKKAFDTVSVDPDVFGQESAIVTLGVGKNMVRSIRHWALACQILEEEPQSRGTRLIPTEIGKLLFGDLGDPYLEDLNTLWLLHWNFLSQTQRGTTWQWAFNKFPSNEFTRESLFEFVAHEARQNGLSAPTENTLKRDIDIFIRSYAPARAAKTSVIEDSLDCPFVELQLLEQTSQAGHYRLKRGPKSTLSNFAFAYCLADFWHRSAPNQKTIALADLAYKPGSPGSVFKLDENSLIDFLETIDEISEGNLTYSESAGIRQVYRRSELHPVSFLRHYYNAPPVSTGVRD
jgi:hypothetical protein